MNKPRQTRKKLPAKRRKYKIKSVKRAPALRPFLTVIGGILLGFLLVFLFLLNPALDTTKQRTVTLPDSARNFIAGKLFTENSTSVTSQREPSAIPSTPVSTNPSPTENTSFNDSENGREYEKNTKDKVFKDSDKDKKSEDTDNSSLYPVNPATPVETPTEPAEQLPLWQKNAAPVPADMPKNAKIVAIIIDDIGIDKSRSKALISIQAPLTLSFITYAEDLTSQIQNAKNTGKELMLHIPMQPSNMTINDGPNSLNTYMSPKDIADTLNSSIPNEILNLGIAGANNHMGSKFTSNKASISAFMHIFKQYDLYFIDSVTHKDSYATASATAEHIATAKRDIFIDNVNDEKYILGQLSKLEKIAKRKGYAIGIGHPHDGTIAALKKWIPALKAKGIYLVPASAVVKRHLGDM